MIRNNLKIACRTLLRHRIYSGINISGLAVGLATTLLILLWIHHEISYDRFHTQHDRIYRVMLNLSPPSDATQTYESVPMPMADALKREIPGVARATRFSWGERTLFSFGDKSITEEGRSVEPDFLKIFHFPLLRGNPATALTEPNTLLITERLARKYFGATNPVGKVIHIDQSTDCKVVGVLADIPTNSTLRFDYLRPFQAKKIQSADWADNNIQVFVMLTPGASAEAVQTQLQRMTRRHLPTMKDRAYFLQAMNDWYLRTDFRNGRYAGGGRIVYVRLFGLVALFVLLIACINFMNLSTARAMQRAKEVGVRKAIGANQSMLIRQFLGESLLLTFLAGGLAVGLVLLVLPFFNELLGKPYFNAPAENRIFIDWQNPGYYGAYFGVLLLTGLLAGLYPAFVLSSFQPVRVLKGLRTYTVRTGWLRLPTIRESLVVVQFMASVLLVIGTVVVYRQIRFIQTINLGYQKENVLYFNWGDIDIDRLEYALQKIANTPGVKAVTLANTDFLGIGRKSYPTWPGQPANAQVLTGILNADANLLPTMGIQLKTGRNFSRTFATDTANVILNEEAVRQMKLKRPIGQLMTAEGISGKVIGVVKDFHLSTIHMRIEPLIIRYRPAETQLIFARIDGHDVPGTVRALEKTYQSLKPGFLFNYIFLDQGYDWMYRTEQQVSTLATWFSGLALFISCLGLFGLASFAVERRTKEIGIRKVLGASLSGIFMLISGEFVVLVLVAIALASFPAWYVMNDWLSQFAYKVNLSWWIFALAGSLAVFIALLTVGFQSIRAALMNPVKSLKTE
ncbi:FtsX-like permease family protein [Larkinella knui]|uniref:FtsX-like permease family protein n=1 Tax=Larkinella knui TaxID=2025310 RepID=A0A3P1CQ03_9BACT|nr:FtsX-like permease family protein [Larkinella knui]